MPRLPTGPGTAFQLALQSGADVVSDTLNLALENGNVLAAVGSLQALGQIASPTQLYGNNAERSPILAALNYPDPRVQFAAAVTVLQLDPDREFSGSGRVVEILTRALGDSGGPAVLVIDPNRRRANDVAGLFQQLKYRGQPITRMTGQEGFKAAVQRNDVELVAIQANVTELDSLADLGELPGRRPHRESADFDLRSRLGRSRRARSAEAHAADRVFLGIPDAGLFPRAGRAVSGQPEIGAFQRRRTGRPSLGGGVLARAHRQQPSDRRFRHCLGGNMH